MGLWDVWDEIADTAVNITSDVVYPGTAPASYEAEAYRDAADQTADWLLDTTEYLLAEGLLPAAAPAVALGGVAHAGPISALSLNSFDLFNAASDTASEWVRSAPGPIVQWVGDVGANAWEWMKNAALNVWDFLVSAVDWVGRTREKAWEWVKGEWEDASKFAIRAIWSITHIDDFIFGTLGGATCLLLGHTDERPYPQIRHICDGAPEITSKLKVAHLPSNQNYVVLSDHHMFYSGSDLDRFNSIKNNLLYLAVLDKYSDDGYSLVLNGDVEDLWLREPTLNDAIVDQFFDCLAGPLGEVLEESYDRRVWKQQLGRIMRTNSAIYAQAKTLFYDKGRMVRTVGNHDMQVQESYLLEDLRNLYPELEVYDYALVVPMDSEGVETGYPDVIIVHGHQFDSWNSRVCKTMAGESVAESVSGIPDVAADVHLRTKWALQMGDAGEPAQGFNNSLIRITLEEWLHFHSTSVDELELMQLMAEAFHDAPKQPYIILGHTHVAHYNPSDEQGRTFEKYLNCGTAGRYEGLLWCVEIRGGEPVLCAWSWGENNKPVKRQMTAGGGNKLFPVAQPES